MDRGTRRKFEGVRRDAGSVENQVIDELVGGTCDRREFIQRASVFGLSLSAIGTALVAAGEAPLAAARPVAGAASGRLRLGINSQPYGAIEPWTLNSIAGADIAAPSAEYLTRVTGKLQIVPELATAWKPSADAKTWTVTLRRNVQFQNGQTMTADDVVATYKFLTDPKKGSTALTNFAGILTPEGVSAKGDNTVVFRLESANAFLPYLISSTSFQTMILPASYKMGTFVSTPQGTGPFTLTNYNTSVSATYEPFANWWGGKQGLGGIDATVFASIPAMDAALRSNTVDLIDDGGDKTVFGKPGLHTYAGPALWSGQVAMRVDTPPWNDYRVRQALAYAIDRPALAKATQGTFGLVGNDSFFAPPYPYTVKLPQRTQNLRLAKQLLAAAGHPNGFKATLVTGNEVYKKTIAEYVQADAKKIGIDITLQLLDPNVYYGSNPKTTPWLNAPFTVTTWASRPTVLQYLTATTVSNAPWNAPHYKNPKIDALVKSFTGAVALSDQRKYAKEIETILLHDVPGVVPVWAEGTTIGSTKVRGFSLDPIGLRLGKVSLASS